MTVLEFLAATEIREHFVRPHIVCNDGFHVSCQFGWAWHCTAYTYEDVDITTVGKIKLYDEDDFKAVELGFPSEKVDIWMDYAEEDSDPTDTVYNWVPIDIVQQGLDLHGGINEEATFKKE